MYELIETSQFRKYLKKVSKRNKADLEITYGVLGVHRAKGVKGVASKMRAHKLSGNYEGSWECHIKPDLLIIWIQIEAPSTIKLVRIGTHSYLF